MTVQHLFIIRGISGAGKSTLASTLAPEGRDVSTDDFFHKDFDRDQPYEFDLNAIIDGSAHGWAENRVKELLADGSGLPVVIANTFTQRWEMEFYLQLCKELGIRCTVCDLYDGGCTDEELFERNAHGVPLEGVQKMRARYEHEWRTANPIKPWLRGGE